MRNDLHTPRALLLAAIVALSCISPFSPSSAANPARLSGDGIKRLITGATVHLHTPLGTVIPVVYDTDGSLRGSAGAVAFYLGSSTDRGKWWVTGSKLCQKWKIWFKGKTNCLQIRQDGNRFHWRDNTGESGVATIVSRPIIAKTTKPASRPTRPRRTAAATKRKPSGRRSALGAPTPAPARARYKPKKSPHTFVKKSKTRRPINVQPARSANGQPGIKAVRRAPTPHNANTPAANPTNSNVAPAAPITKKPKRAFKVVNVSHDDVLNIRINPYSDSPIVGAIAPNGRGIKVVGACRDYWCPVVHRSGHGWVNRAFLAKETPRNGRQSPRRRAQTYRVVGVGYADVLNIRNQPSPDAYVVGTVPANASGIRVIGQCKGYWCPIKHARKRGWVSRYFIAPVTRHSSRTR